MGIMLVVTVAVLTIVGMICVIMSIVTETDTIEQITIGSENIPVYKDSGIVIVDE